MKKIIKEYEVYEFNELSEEAKERVLERLYDINVDFNWWECAYEDAETVGIKIEHFDLDRGNSIGGKFTFQVKEVAESIIQEHGESCDTYKIAKDFLDKILPLEMLEKMGQEFDESKFEELSEEFEKEIFNEYLKILRKKYEYLTSKEAIVEAIEANEYEFTKDGNLFK